MEALESGHSTSSAASEVMQSKDEIDNIAKGGGESNVGPENHDVEADKQEKKSFRFKLTVFNLCFISVVVAMVSLLVLASQFNRDPIFSR